MTTGARKSSGTTEPEVAAEKGRRDTARSPRPTLRRALAGRALVAGAPSRSAALLEAGFAPSVARNPSHCGLTVPALLDAAAAIFPEEPTLRSLRGKSLRVLDAGLTDDDLPLVERARLAGSIVKLADESGIEEQDPKERRESELLLDVHYATRLLAGLIAGSRLVSRDPEILANWIDRLRAEIAHGRELLAALEGKAHRAPQIREA